MCYTRIIIGVFCIKNSSLIMGKLLYFYIGKVWNNPPPPPFLESRSPDISRTPSCRCHTCCAGSSNTGPGPGCGCPPVWPRPRDSGDISSSPTGKRRSVNWRVNSTLSGGCSCHSLSQSVSHINLKSGKTGLSLLIVWKSFGPLPFYFSWFKLLFYV